MLSLTDSNIPMAKSNEEGPEFETEVFESTFIESQKNKKCKKKQKQCK